jgi:hypothetical protein
MTGSPVKDLDVFLDSKLNYTARHYNYIVAKASRTLLNTERSKSLSIKWAMTMETNVVGLQHIWRVFK